MQYLLLIYGDENVEVPMCEQQEILAEYQALTKSLVEAGVFVAGDALQPTPSATTVRVRAGKTLTTDGPFAETKEQLGGYFLVECDDLDQALQIAARIPTARSGSVEVRPISVEVQEAIRMLRGD